jgi:hypothetical protein
VVIAVVLALCAGCGGQSAAEALPRAEPVVNAEPAESAPAVASEPASSDSTTRAPAEAGAPAAGESHAAVEPAAPAGQRPPADRTPRKPGEAERISFDDLNLGMQADMVYRPFLLTDRVKELEGQRVSIMGYIHAGATGKGIKEFVLLKNTECKFGPGGQADHLAMIYLDKGQTTEYQTKAIKVEGVLTIEPKEGLDQNTWSIYRLDSAKIVR